MAAAADPVAVTKWLVAVPAFVGGLSAYQAVYAKFPATTTLAFKHGGVWAYLVSRALVAAGSYLAVGYFRDPAETVNLGREVLVAFSCGFGAEAILRARFYIGPSKTASGATEPSFKGVFDLVEWYQNLFLNSAGNWMAVKRNEIVEKQLSGDTDYLVFVQRVRSKAQGWPADQKEELLKKIHASEAEYKKQNDTTAGTQKDFINSLGFAILDQVGKSGLQEVTRKA